jgi:DNA-binding LacI/PurR family transcriptional regulator
MAGSKKGPIRLDQRATAKQVAQLAGVSIAAVSRTFTEGASVSSRMREKVLTATRSLGYHPNVLARSLMTKRTELIGLVSTNFDHPTLMEVLDLFTRRLQQSGRRPLLANLSGGASIEAAVEMLLQYRVDGVIIASATLPAEFVTACVEAGLPVVQAFGGPKGKRSVHIVAADSVGGGRLAGAILQERGYRNIAFLGGPEGNTSTEDRLKGLTEHLAAHRLRPCAVVYARSHSHEEGLTLTKQLLRHGGIDAIFCADDTLAMGAIDACRELGANVPGDVGILGFDGIAMGAWPAYNLTTIRMPIADIVTTAVEMVLGLVGQPFKKKPEVRLFECQAVIRKTLRSAPLQ